jgi:hypothetical protein
VSIDIEGPDGSEVVTDILRAFRLDEPRSLGSFVIDKIKHAELPRTLITQRLLKGLAVCGKT